MLWVYIGPNGVSKVAVLDKHMNGDEYVFLGVYDKNLPSEINAALHAARFCNFYNWLISPCICAIFMTLQKKDFC